MPPWQVKDMAQEARPGQSRSTPAWVKISWLTLQSALLVGLGLWIAQVAQKGVPGPVIAGVYVNGGVDVAVLAVYVLTAAGLTTVAAVMVARVPDNRIGWILGAVAVWTVATFLLIMVLNFLHSPGDGKADLANWLGTWTMVPLVPTSLVLMIFPSGTLPSPRWRILGWLAVAGTTGWAVAEASREGLGLQQELFNPYANPDLARVGDAIALLLLPAFAGTVASLIVRFRRSDPGVRLQMKWVVWGGMVQVASILIVWAASVFSRGAFPVEAALLGMLSTLIVPVTLGVAILRYRLYEINRLISRTVTYAFVIGILGVVYSGGVFVVNSLLPLQTNLAVAGSTLAVAALLNPLRRRVRDSVDRRFNRVRHDALRTVTSFGTRLRDDVDLESIQSDLMRVITKTWEPSEMSFWIDHGVGEHPIRTPEPPQKHLVGLGRADSANASPRA